MAHIAPDLLADPDADLPSRHRAMRLFEGPRGRASRPYDVGSIGRSKVCLRSFVRKMRDRIPEARLHRAHRRGGAGGQN